MPSSPRCPRLASRLQYRAVQLCRSALLAPSVLSCAAALVNRLHFSPPNLTLTACRFCMMLPCCGLLASCRACKSCYDMPTIMCKTLQVEYLQPASPAMTCPQLCARHCRWNKFGSDTHEYGYGCHYLPHLKSNSNTNMNLFIYEYKTNSSNSNSHLDIYSAQLEINILKFNQDQ
jgi:hypothetical protein